MRIFAAALLILGLVLIFSIEDREAGLIPMGLGLIFLAIGEHRLQSRLTEDEIYDQPPNRANAVGHGSAG